MIHLWIQERSKESRAELGEEATDLIRRSWNIVWRSSDFDQRESFSRRVIPHLDAVVEHFYRKPGISEASLTPPKGSKIASADFLAGTNDTVCNHIQCLGSTCRLSLRDDYPLPWWQSMHLLGEIYALQGLYKKAEALYRATFAEAWSTLPREYHHAIEIAQDLANSISEQNRFDESLQWYSWALNSDAKILGGMNQKNLLYRIGSVHESQGNYDEALIYYRSVVGEIDETFGQINLSLRSCRSIANILRSTGNSESVLWREREFLLLNESPSHEPSDVFESSIGVTTSLVAFGEYEKAKEWATKSFELYRSLKPYSMTNCLNIFLTIRLHTAAGEICLRLHEYQEALRLYTFLLSKPNLHDLWSKPNPHDLLYKTNSLDLLSEFRQLHLRHKMIQQHSFEDDLQWGPTFADLFFFLGFACFKLERYEEASDWLSKALLEAHRGSMEFTRLLDIYEMIAYSSSRNDRANDASKWNARAYHLQDKMPKGEASVSNAVRDKALVGMGESLADLARAGTKLHSRCRYYFFGANLPLAVNMNARELFSTD